MTTEINSTKNTDITYRGRNLILQTLIEKVKTEPSFINRSHSKRLALEAQFWSLQTELDTVLEQINIDHFKSSITEESDFEHVGFPTHDSEFGLYIPQEADFSEVQYGVFSSVEVAKSGLKKLDSSLPILFGIISRIKKEGVEQLEGFFKQFVALLVEYRVKSCDLTLGGLDLSRLGRSYSSFSALLELFELSSESEIGLTLMGLANPVAIFGILTGAIAQTQMRFNQTVSRLRTNLSKGLEYVKYVKASVSDLFNNKSAYQPHLTIDEYILQISSMVQGNTSWIEFIK